MDDPLSQPFASSGSVCSRHPCPISQVAWRRVAVEPTYAEKRQPGGVGSGPAMPNTSREPSIMVREEENE